MSTHRWTPTYLAGALHRRGTAYSLAIRKKIGQKTLPMLASTVAFMAKTGAGTDECLTRGALPLPVHFYSPVPDIEDLRTRQVWTHRSQMTGINFAEQEQLAFLAQIGENYGEECDWPHRSNDPLAFQTDNSGFSYGCASILHSILRHLKPRRVIEVGSGNSTRVIANALRMNQSDDVNCNFTVVDPYPSDFTRSIPEINNFEVQRVEVSDPKMFDTLGSNDVLFVDSGHTVRIGGDVNFMILDILPRLNPGVVVHFHDIPMPYEYNEVYYTNSAFRMLWTESYLLQAFLCLNDSFETMLAMSYIMSDHKAEFQRAFPKYNPAIHVNSSSSYWIRRTR